ncbi:MAG: type II toxin-antitoxin system VapC family toxin [Truepera sp.]|nr:type II toxin-antitoxin system VapC family toxin [Truepera sp.]
MPPVLVDTAVIYALADRRDGAHQAARELLKRLLEEGAPLLVSLPTVYEAHRLILYRLGTQPGLRFLTGYGQLYNLVWPTEGQHLQATELLQRFADQKISLTDAVTAVIAQEVKGRVATFDHHYELMGARAVKR